MSGWNFKELWWGHLDFRPGTPWLTQCRRHGFSSWKSNTCSKDRGKTFQNSSKFHHLEIIDQLHSLELTASSPLKKDGWNTSYCTSFLLGQKAYFHPGLLLLVSGRVNKTTDFVLTFLLAKKRPRQARLKGIGCSQAIAGGSSTRGGRHMNSWKICRKIAICITPPPI